MADLSAISAVLRQDEQPIYAIHVEILQNEKTSPRLIALVVNKNGGDKQRGLETALFILRKTQGSVEVEATFPVYSDFNVTQEMSSKLKNMLKSDNILRFQPEPDSPDSILFEVENVYKLKEFTNAVKKAKERAQTRPEEGNVTHEWLEFYNRPELEAISRQVEAEGVAPNYGDPANVLESYMQQTNEYNPQMFQKIKEQWVAKQMKLREPEYVKEKPLRVFIGTFNVNGKVPKESLAPWLYDESQPDIYAIGFQELDLSAEAFVFNDSTREEDWAKCIEAGLGPNNTYVKLKSKQLVGMLLTIYVKASLQPHISDVQAEMVGTGIMGMMGNKGGVSVRFKIFDSTVCFVNTHLAANMSEVARRNQDYQEVCRRMVFQQQTKYGPKQTTIFDHDILFWLGDLNYRINLPDTVVKEAVKAADYEKLWAADQLLIERKASRAFPLFLEGTLDFAPTYKYDPGTDDFDSSEKRRVPAWCDRVLWKGDNIKQLTYRGHMALKTSDHKPVSSMFEVKAKVINPEIEREIHQSIVRELDKMENECMPDAKVSANMLSFKDVKFLVPMTKEIMIENIGQVVVQYRFIPKPDEKTFCKPWLIVTPHIGMIMPGDKAAVSFTVLVDRLTAPALGSEQEKLEDILVLHLENGKDYFISISGNYLPSCFGTSLKTLVKVGPIRGRKPDDTTKSHIPEELWRMVDFLFSRGLDEPGLFLNPGDRGDMDAIRECLDTGAEFTGLESKVLSMAETLIRWLESLPVPVIPFNAYQKCLDCCNSYILCKQVISQLSSVHYNVFVYLMAFLREVLEHSARNGLTTEKLALLFGNVLLRSPQIPTGNKIRDALEAQKKATFVYHFLSDQGEPKLTP
eukprot:Colp12_sorted_trinity150504_noHs@19516